MKTSPRSLAAAGLALVLLFGLVPKSSEPGDNTAGFQPAVLSAKAASHSRSTTTEAVSHDPYIQGSDGFFHPDRTITRAQIAQLLCNLGISKPGEAVFSDVADNQWFAPAVKQVSALLTGYEDGTFRPNAVATMGEFVTILCRALETELPTLAPAEAAPWYAASWAAAEDLGWFPDAYTGQGLDPVTRAMVVAVLNRATGRTPDTDAIDQLDRLCFVDVQPDHWAYYEILEAAIGHRCKDDGSWEPDSLVLPELPSGLYISDGAGYYIEPSGTLYRTPGILELDGSRYLVADETGRIWADNAIHPYGSTLVCCAGNGKLLTSDSFHGFRFDAEGFYTSGNEEIDGYVDAILAQYTTASMTQMEKLRAVFDLVRGYKYLGRNATISDAVMSEEQASKYASKIFETGKGDCYNFTAAFYYLARALGYDATAVVGTCSYTWNSRPISHAWVEIPLDGTVYLFDPQIENYNLRNGISNETNGAFQVTYQTAHATYFKN